MTTLKLAEIHDRGLTSFESLSPLERDAFVLIDLDLYYEMEGGFEDYLSSGGHESELAWLADTLRRIGDEYSASIISRLRQMDEAGFDETNLLCEQYYNLRHSRWELLRRYLTQHGAVLEDGTNT